VQRRIARLEQLNYGGLLEGIVLKDIARVAAREEQVSATT
jgi:hypothetical protein